MAFDSTAHAPSSSSDGASESPSSSAAAGTATPSANAGGASRGDNRAMAAQRRARTRTRHSMAFVDSKVTLNSYHAQQAFDRVYEQAAESLHTLAVLVRVVASEEMAVQVDQAVTAEMLKVEGDMKQEFARLEALADSHGIATTITYSAPKTHTVQITSPRAAMYLRFMTDLDRLVGMLDALWLSNIISDADLSRAVYSWKKRLFRLAGSFRELARRGMSSAQRSGVDQVQDPRAGTVLDPDGSSQSAEAAGGASDSSAEAPAVPTTKKRAAAKAAPAAESVPAEAVDQEAALAG